MLLLVTLLATVNSMVNTLNSCEGTKVASAFTCSRIRTLMAGLLIFVCLFFLGEDSQWQAAESLGLGFICFC